MFSQQKVSFYKYKLLKVAESSIATKPDFRFALTRVEVLGLEGTKTFML